MTPPLLPLRAAVRALCLADPALASLMGGAVRVDDEPPRGAAPVYATFGDAVSRDASTSGSAAHETEFALVVWGTPGSAASALAAASRMAVLLDGAALLPAGHHLIGLAVLDLSSDRDPETHLARATLRLRAATEVAP